MQRNTVPIKSRREINSVWFRQTWHGGRGMCAILAWLLIPCFAALGGELRVGLFDVDVSPAVGTPLTYGTCLGVAMPLHASGMVILGDEQPIVICAVDWIGIANDAHQQWCARLAAAVGTEPDRVSVHTLHQHDAPICDFAADAVLAEHGLSGTMFDVKFAQDSIARVALAAALAKDRAERVTHVGIGAATVQQVASNRRILGPDGKVRATRYTACTDPELRAEPAGVVDDVLKSISLWSDERPVAVLTFFATHPQSYYLRGIANPDFPGMARFLRQVTLNGLPHIHFNGAGGNIGAGKYNDGSPGNRQLLAERMAHGMADAWETTTRHPISAAEVVWRRTELVMEAAPHLDEPTLLAQVSDATSTPAVRGDAARDLVWLRRTQRHDPLAVSCLQLGPARILQLPGEAVVEYQLYAQQRMPDQFVATAAYGDYGTGYICLEEHYTQGGYEASPRASRVAPHTEVGLKQAIDRVLTN